jgi:S-adenosylmethionine synthetase
MLGKFSIQVLPSQDEVSFWLMPDGSADSVVDAIHQNKKMKRVAFEHTLFWRIVLVCQKILIANNGESMESP